jgi:hypothetical protein
MNAVDTILNYSLLLRPVNLFETLYHFTRHCCSIFKLLNLNLMYPSFEIRAICVSVCKGVGANLTIHNATGSLYAKEFEMRYLTIFIFDRLAI